MPPASVSSVIVTPTFSHVPSTSASVHVTVLESVNGGKNKVVYEGEEQKVSSEELEVSSIRLVLLPSGASQRFTFVLADGSSASVLGQAQVSADDLTSSKSVRMEREGGSSSNGNNVDALAEELYAGQLSMKLSVPEGDNKVVFAAFADFNRSASRAALLSGGGSEVSLAATGLFSFDSLSKSCPVVGVFSSGPDGGRLLDYSDIVAEDHSPSFRLRVAIPAVGDVVFKVYDASNGNQGLDSSNLLGQTAALNVETLKAPAAFALSNPTAPALDKKLKKKNACIKIAPASSAAGKTPASAAAVAGLQVQVSSSSASSSRPAPIARTPSTPYSSAVSAGSHAPSASDIVIVDASGLEHKAKVVAGAETVSLNVSARNLVKLQAMSTGVAPCVALWEKNASSGSYALLAHTEPQQSQADPRFVTPLNFTLSSASGASSPSAANADQYRVDVYDVAESRVGVSSDRVGFAYLSRGALASLASSEDYTETSLALQSDKVRLQSKLVARGAAVQLARAGAPPTTVAQREAQRAQALQTKQAALASKKAAWASSRQAQQAAVGLGAAAATVTVVAAAPEKKEEEVKPVEEVKAEEPVAEEAVAVVAAPKALVAEEEGAGAASAAPASIPIEDEEPVAVAAAAEPEQQQQQINVVPATPVAAAKVEEPVAAAAEEPVAVVAAVEEEEKKVVEEPVVVAAATEAKPEDHLAIGAGAALPPMGRAGAGSRRGSLGGVSAGAGAGSRRGSLNGSMGAIEVENTADMEDAILAEKVAQARVEEAAAIVESFHGAGKQNKVAADRHAAEADLVQAQKELEAAKARAVDAKAALAVRRKARAEAEAAEAERKAKINAVRALDPSSHTVWGTRKRNSHGSSMQLSERMAAALANSGRNSLSLGEDAPTNIKDMVLIRRAAASAATALAQVALLPNRSGAANATIYSLATSVKNVKNSGAWNPCLGLYEQGKDESSWVFLDHSEKIEGVGMVGSGEFRKHMLVESIPDSSTPQLLRFHLFNAGSKDEDLTASEDLIASGSIPLAKLLELAGEVVNGASKPVEVFLYSAGNKALSDRLKRQHASVLVTIVGSQPASEGAEGRQTSLIVGSAPIPLVMEGCADPDPSAVAFALVTPDSASASAAAALAAEEHAATTSASSSVPAVVSTEAEAAPAAAAEVAAAPVQESKEADKVAEAAPVAESKPEVAEAAPEVAAAEPVAAAEVAASAVEVPAAAAAAEAEEKPKVEEAAPVAAAAEEPAAAVVAEEPAAAAAADAAPASVEVEAAAEGEKADESAAAGAEAEEEEASGAASPSASAGGEDKKKKKKNKKKGGK